MNAKKGFYNAFFGILGQIISIGLGIIIPRLVLVNLGSEANGLLSSITQALVYLNLLEAGIGTATLQALYKPVAQEEKHNINKILSATNIYYHRVGMWYLLAVVILSICFPLLVKTSIPFTTVFLVILFSGLSQAINFWFQGKYRILLQAEGKNYVLINLGTVVNALTSIIKVVLLIQGYSILSLQIMYFIFSLLQMIYIIIYIRRKYRWIDLTVDPDYRALSQKNSVLLHQMSGLIFQNTDVLILSFFCGLSTVSVYSMYAMLFGMISTAITIINSSVSFAMGQAFNTNKVKFVKMYNAFETYNMTLTFSLYCVAGVFILPFLRLYTEGIHDINYIDNILPYLFIATFLLSNGRSAAQRVIEYAGHFKLTQNRSIIESVINLSISLLAVKQFGIYGVLIGTIAALLYRTTDMIFYASKKLLHRSPVRMYFKWILNAGIFVALTILLRRFLSGIIMDSYIKLIGYAACMCLFVCTVFLVIDSLVDLQSFKYCSNIGYDFFKKSVRKFLKK